MEKSMRCEECEKEFVATEPARCEQRFCSSECRKRWHYLEKKRAGYAAEVRRAEAQGRGEVPRIDLQALGLLGRFRTKSTAGASHD